MAYILDRPLTFLNYKFNAFLVGIIYYISVKNVDLY